MWQKSMELVVAVYALLKYLPKEEMYGLSDQIRRSVVSIPSNIAEGHGRETDKEFIRFLTISRGSVFELETQLEICFRLGYLTSPQFNEPVEKINEVRKMLNGLIAYRESRDKF